MVQPASFDYSDTVETSYAGLRKKTGQEGTDHAADTMQLEDIQTLIDLDPPVKVMAQSADTTSEESDEKTLRGSSQEIADLMQAELQNKVTEAGLEILDVRITHLAYAPEIASAMLQRQQAAAVIDARQKIVEGAVSMVEMALKQLSENQIVELDEERKAAMVSNLLVVLCGNKDAQPVVNSGSIY